MGRTVKYETKYGNLEVSYAAGKCAESKSPYAFDIAADVVVGLTIFPNEIVFADQLGYKLERFKQKGDSETDKTYSFEAVKSGIEIEIESAQVASVYLFIPKPYLEKLHCKGIKVKEPDWFEKLRKLELFASTRNDLEILFENPRIVETEDDTETDGSVEVEYETVYGALTVEYSTGKCAERQSRRGYDAERNTILRLELEPTEQFDLTEFNYDFRTFEGGRDSCMPDFSSRRSDLLGLEFIMTDSKIRTVEFSPNEKQEELDCDKVFNSQK